jgi:hypothetical protein
MAQQFGTLAPVIAGEDQHCSRVPVFAQTKSAFDEKSPIGTTDNSPAIHRWDQWSTNPSKPRRGERDHSAWRVCSFVPDGTCFRFPDKPSVETLGYCLSPWRAGDSRVRVHPRASSITESSLSSLLPMPTLQERCELRGVPRRFRLCASHR